MMVKEPKINLNEILESAWNHADEIREDLDSGDTSPEMVKAIMGRAEAIMALLDPFVGDQADYID